MLSKKDSAMAQMAAKLGAVPLKAGDPQQQLTLAISKVAGVWTKDRQRSDCMSVIGEVMDFSSLMVHAMNMIRGVEIAVKDGAVIVGVFSVVQWFQIHEQYRLDGSVTRSTRRDLRRGGHYGCLLLEGDRVVVRFAWPDPHAGEGSDELVLVGSDELHIVSELKSKGRACRYTQVFRRQA